MVHVVEHKIFVIAETKINTTELGNFLEELGAPNWTTDTAEDAAVLSEVMGRLCYKSFEAGLNPNVSKVREGNQPYMENILAQKHGSVIEHSYVTLGLLNVSRVFTHELVRHRPNNYSQESLRFVRLAELGVYMPKVFEPEHLVNYAKFGAPTFGSTPEVWAKAKSEGLKESFLKLFEKFEEWIEMQSELLSLNEEGMPFKLKKAMTSALRRAAPHGLTTNIGVTGNHRAWRYEIEARTSPGAEEEIQAVFYDIAKMFKAKYPNIYQDMYLNEAEVGPVEFKNKKV